MASSALVQQELSEFLYEVEAELLQFQQDLESGLPTDTVLLQAEWLLRDILLIEGLLPPPDGEALTEVVIATVQDLQVIRPHS